MFCNLTFNTTSNTIRFCCAWYAKDVTPVLNVPSFLVAKTCNFISTALSNVSWCPGPKGGSPRHSQPPADRRRDSPCRRHHPTTQHRLPSARLHANSCASPPARSALPGTSTYTIRVLLSTQTGTACRAVPSPGIMVTYSGASPQGSEEEPAVQNGAASALVFPSGLRQARECRTVFTCIYIHSAPEPAVSHHTHS